MKEKKRTEAAKRCRAGLAGLLCLVIMISAISVSAFADDGYKKVLNSVVRVYQTFTFVVINREDTSKYYTFDLYSTGSGIAIGNDGEKVDRFLTNKHVVEVDEDECFDLIKYWYPYYFSEGKWAYGADNIVTSVIFDDLDTKKEVTRIITSDKYDLACVVIPTATDLREPAVIGLYDSIEREECWALGFPALSDDLISKTLVESLPSSPEFCTVTQGMTQFLTENSDYGSCVQHTASISHGNSGGPLVNKDGLVIGVNTWGFAEDAVQSNIAQTTQQVKQFLDSENIKAIYKEIKPVPEPVVIVAISVAAVAVIAVIVTLIVTNKKKNKKQNKKQSTGEFRTLIVEKGSLEKGKQYVLQKGKSYKIGTDDSKCQIVFAKQTPGVSHVHCSVLFDGQTVRVKDEGSSYGTMIDDQKISASGESVLHRGHMLSIGSSKEKFVLR